MRFLGRGHAQKPRACPRAPAATWRGPPRRPAMHRFRIRKSECFVRLSALILVELPLCAIGILQVGPVEAWDRTFQNGQESAQSAGLVHTAQKGSQTAEIHTLPAHAESLQLCLAHCSVPLPTRRQQQCTEVPESSSTRSLAARAAADMPRISPSMEDGRGAL